MRIFLAVAAPVLVFLSGAGLCGGMGADGKGQPPPAVAASACRTIAGILAVYPVLEVEASEGPVRDPLEGSERPGCLVLASGPASGLAGEVPPEEPIRFLLGESGWEEDPRYSADGPGTASFALRKDGALCLLGGGAPSRIEAGEILSAERFVFEAACAADPAVGEPGPGRGPSDGGRAR